MIKAIETRYKGYRFRSRLVARWAVFFDTLGIKWEYEPEGFVLPDGTYYLPDFRVTTPQGNTVWYEVKPEGVTSDAKFSAFVNVVEAQEISEWMPSVHFCLLSGDPVSFLEAHSKNGGVCPRCGIVHSKFQYGVEEIFFRNVRVKDVVSVGCWHCDITTPCGDMNHAEEGITVPSRPHKGCLHVEIPDWHRHLSIVKSAAKSARSARFEHGQSGGAA